MNVTQQINISHSHKQIWSYTDEVSVCPMMTKNKQKTQISKILHMKTQRKKELLIIFILSSECVKLVDLV